MSVWKKVDENKQPTRNDADMFNNVIAFDAEHNQEILINVFEFKNRKNLTHWRETGITPKPI